MLQIPRTRKTFFIFVFLLTLNISLFIIFRPFPTIEHFVEQTNRKIKYIRTLNLKDLEVDQSYLEYLGFLEQPTPLPSLKSFNMVVVGSAVSSGDLDSSYLLIAAVRLNLPTSPVVLFDIGLRSWDANQLKKRCNETTNCKIRGFEFDKFPPHVAHTRTKAYKPLAIQILLHEYGNVVWTDLSGGSPYNPIHGDWWGTLQRTRASNGLLAWPLASPTSALTHPRMLAYLKVNQEDFYFHRMVASAHLILFNTGHIRKEVMLPWVKCALAEDCLSPLGAQNSGCNFDRQPYFRYTGCHWFEMSALNVILGPAFHFNTSGYTAGVKLFGVNDNDTELYNHFPIAGLNLDHWRIRLNVR